MEKRPINMLPELKQKIENLLKSTNLDEGLKLLKDINNEAVIECFSSLIQERVRENYFEGISDMSQVAKGLAILKEFTPNLTSLDISLCELDSLDVSDFINLISLNASYCSNLTNIQGLENLKNLENLNVKNSPCLLNLDVYQLENLYEVVGLRTNAGMHFGGNIEAYEEDWWDHLDFLFDELELEHLFGDVGIITISEADFHDKTIADFRWSGPKSINVSTREKLGFWIGDDKLDIHFSEKSYIWPSAEEVTLALFTSDWTFITCFTRHRDDFSIE
ncbi:MAG: hypothetical protein CMD22_05925 [Flavobacteriales bacterium]|nr:hypothetical protein [Flavobacteriales bacterium]|tara:strand:+ start:1081 stop:1911 length:831 start_codon:yes stop_codon:yes gene_type:complete